MTEDDIELSENDFSKGRSRIKRYGHKVTELPSRLRLAAQSAWRGKERGMAVIAGVSLLLWLLQLY